MVTNDCTGWHEANPSTPPYPRSLHCRCDDCLWARCAARIALSGDLEFQPFDSYVFALRAAEKRQIAYPDGPLWLHGEGGRSVDAVLNADSAAMAFYGLAGAGIGNEKGHNRNSQRAAADPAAL
ncbi:hypothetical protein GmRootV35_13890 [Variovorax sp. V35]